MTRTLICASALALMAGAASAATYTFNSGPAVSPTLSGDIFTITANADGVLNSGVPQVSQTVDGLGVFAGPDSQPGMIDGNPTVSAESLTVTFDYAVTLDSFSLFGVDTNGNAADEYNFYVDGVLYTDQGTDPNPLIGEVLTSFTIEARTDLANDPSPLGGEGFKLASFTVSPVPLPATAGLLASVVGGLVLLRRRRSA